MTRRSLEWLLTPLVAVSVLVPAASFASAASCPSYAAPVVSGHIDDGRINEASGLVAAGRVRKTFWLEEDSGNGSWVYAVSAAGRVRDAIELRNATNSDWEDIARARGRIWIGDIGANLFDRERIQVYWFREPRSLSADRVNAKVMTLRYPNNVSHNAEAMIVDGRSQRLFIFEKQRSTSTSRVFGVTIRGARSGDSLRLKKVARVPLENITAADLGRTGIVIKNYGEGMLFPWVGHRVVGTLRQSNPCSVALPSGEAVAFSKSGDRIYTVPEGSNPPIAHADRT